MNKKRKVLKRISALVGVVAVIISVLVIPSGAWEKEDIPFYNYFDCGVFEATNDIGDRTDIASIVSSDSDTGYIMMNANFNGRNSPYVPTSYSNVTLSRACPDLVVGETYVLSGDEYFLQIGSGEALDISMFPCIVLKKSGAPDVRWYIGESLTITSDMLDRYIMLYAGKTDSVESTPALYSCGLRLWINKGEAASFEPHNLFKDIQDDSFEQGKNVGLVEGKEQGYNEGYDVGYNEGYDTNVMDNLLVSKNNVSIQLGFYNTLTSTYEYVSYDHLDYPFNGYSFNSRLLNSNYTTPPNANSYLSRIHAMLIPRTYGVEYIVGSSQFSFIANHTYGMAEITVMSDAIDNTLHTETRRYASAGVGQSVLVDFGDFGLEEGDTIDSIAITYYEYGSSRTSEGFSFAFTDTTGNAYTVGVEEGKSQGYVVGKIDGYDAGMLDGFAEGYAEGREIGYRSGYANGDNSGYYRGRADEARNNGFSSLISSVIDVPIGAFRSLFNFNILGVNMAATILSLCTLSIVIIIVKKVV